MAPTATAGPRHRAAPLATVPRNRTFISVGVGGESPERFNDVELQNPFLPGITRSGYQVVMEPLFYYNPYHTSTVCGPASVLTCDNGVIPWLAAHYAFNADYTTAVVNLREGVSWSDGQPFTAQDVVFTINMLRDNAPDLRWSIDMRHWVREVIALDAFTVQFSLSQPNPRFIFGYFTYHEDFGIQIVPSHVFAGQDPRTFNNYDLARGWPVVTGPYRLVHSDPQQKIWDRRDDWWGATTGFQTLPEVERLVFHPGVSEAQMVDLIDKNQVDTTLSLSWSGIENALSGNMKVTSWTGGQGPFGYVDYWVTGLGFNDMLEPFSDPDIRWAINHAINRDELVAIGYHGAGEIALLPYPDFPALRPYLDAVADLVQKSGIGDFDLMKTQQLLQSKGYSRDAAGYWNRGGLRLSIPIVTFTVEQDIATVLVDQLRRAGFDATLTISDNYETLILNGLARAYVYGHIGSTHDPYYSMRLYQSQLSAPTGQRAFAPFRWRSPRFDTLVDRMSTVARGDPQLTSLFRDALEVWLPNLPDIPLVQFYHRIPVNTTYWTNWPDATNPYINTANWHRTFELVLLNLRTA